MSHFKKEIGFIRTQSKKQLRQNQGSSSSSFSSFQYCPIKNKNQFSPYRPLNPQSLPKNKIENNVNIINQYKQKINKKQLPFTNDLLRSNLSKQDLQYQNRQVYQRIQQVNQKIKKAQTAFRYRHSNQQKYDSQQSTPKLRQQDQFQNQQVSLSNLNKFQQRTSQNLTNNQINIRNNKKIYAEDNSDTSSEENYKNIKKIPTNKPKISFDQELIQQWDKKQFKDKSIKRAVQENEKNYGNTSKSQTKIVKHTGGVCFELDKRQFKADPINIVPVTRKTKKNINSKEQILKRKLKAKCYDKMARSKIFGY